MSANKRILIVDDQQDLREHMAKMLTNSAKNSSSASLVQQMRNRLLGTIPEPEERKPEDEYEVDTAGQGQEAFEMVKASLENHTPYAVMFLDMRMPPGWDGMETAKRIREIDKRIEIVIMTAYADHDQATIASTVGMPEKLLYIKKPFQTEEIFQLALSLTSKWNEEEDGLLRKNWLEKLVRGMSRIKSDKDKNVPMSVMSSILTFMSADKGFLITVNDHDKTWNLEYAQGLDNHEIAECVAKNKTRIFDCHATQCVDNQYYLPLKRGGYSAVAVVYFVATPNDPEWFKLLSLLSMTSSEILCADALNEDNHKRERTSRIGRACGMVAADTRKRLGKMLERVGTMKQATPSGDLDFLSESLQALLMNADLLLEYGNDEEEPENTEMIPLADLLKDALGSAKQRFSGKLMLSGMVVNPEKSFEVRGNPEQLKGAFLHVITALASASVTAMKTQFTLNIQFSDHKVVLDSDVPRPTLEALGELFEPFNKDAGDLDRFGLSLPIARQVLKLHHAALFFDSHYENGQRFTIQFP